jgi:hypothetical protein
MTAPANPPPTPTTPADAGTPPDPMRDVLNHRQYELVCRCMDEAGIGEEAELVEVVRDIARRLASVERERDAAAERLRQIADVCRAYPTQVFAEPDLDKARRLLEAGGVSLDSVSAKAARTVADYIITLATNAMRTAPE